MTALTDLSLGNCSLGNHDIDVALAGLHSTLTRLDLRRCYMDDVSKLAAFTALTSLSVAEVDSVTEASLQALLTLTALTRLDLGKCRDAMLPSGLAALAPLTGLASLSLAGSVLYSQTFVGVAALGASLTRLDLRGCQVSGCCMEDLWWAAVETEEDRRRRRRRRRDGQATDGLRSLSRLTALTDLNLAWSRGPGLRGSSHTPDGYATYCHLVRGLSAIADSLTALNLNRCEALTDEAVAGLAPLTNLTSLNVEGCDRLTGISLSQLAPLTGLRTLGLSVPAGATDRQLRGLAPLVALETLRLGDSNHGARVVAMRRLKALVPEIHAAHIVLV
jgi:hypothetical protein